MAVGVPAPTGNVQTDTQNIQDALDSGKEVWIQHSYVHSGLTVTTDRQRIRCESDSNLAPEGPDDAIVITGHGVELVGLRIVTDVASNGLVKAQARTTFRDLYIHAENALLAVEITSSVRTSFHAGEIYGDSGDATPDSVGLLCGEGANEVKAFGLTVHHWDTGIRFAGSNHDTPGFFGCSIENNESYGLRFDPDTTGVMGNLSLVNCHFEGSPINVFVGDDGHLHSGAIRDCRFGLLTARVLHAEGGLINFVVANCFMDCNSLSPGYAIYEVNGQCIGLVDWYNFWKDCTAFATGTQANHVARVRNEALLELRNGLLAAGAAIEG